MRLKHIGFSLLLVLGMANTFAGPAGYRGESFNAVRTYQMQGFTFDRGERRPMPQSDRETGRRDNRDQALPDSSGYGAQGEAAPPPDNMRKQGRLSPEERRALRRQIDEAGNDIYRPKR